jgi:hypothetical protein
MRKRTWVAVGFALILVSGTVAWKGFRISELAQIGVGYAAQRTCSCLFISHRSPESCETDLDPMARRFVPVEVGAGEVTSRIFGLARARARYQQGFGCSLDE